jgi:glycine hydroxymethyltransferase
LRDSKYNDDMRVDIALQGPKSQEALLLLDWEKNTAAEIRKLKRTQLKAVKLNGTDLIVSRTGYTGEKMAFELFIHPQAGVDLWKVLLERADSLGIKPCGLGARDSLRTEAGLPLYGHEMAGPHNLSVGDAGFATYVKTYKPWFVGREAFIEQEKIRKNVVVRFRFNEKRVRMAHSGDPVIDEKGKVVGFVTSCAIDSEEYLTGQAYIDRKLDVEGTSIFIYQNAAQQAAFQLNTIKTGDRINLPSSASILSRFPKLYS